MSILVKGAGGAGGATIDFSTLTPQYSRGYQTITGLTVGHRYLVAVSNLNYTGSAQNVCDYNFPYVGFTNVEIAIRFGDGSGANANQRAEGAVIVGTATSTSATIGEAYTANDKQAILFLDLG